MKRCAWNRALATILTVAMILSMWMVPVSAKTFSDTQGHWAAEFIDKWSDYKLLEGIGDNTFEPERNIQISEVSKIISVLMGYTDEVDNAFTDVPGDAWYEEYILRMAAAGLLPTSGAVRPEEAITRGEVFTILAKAFGIAPVEGETIFADNASIPAAQKPYIKALYEAGAVNGRPAGDGLLAAPEAFLMRAELMKLFDRLAGDWVFEAGEYTNNYAGSLVVSAAGVKLSGITIGGNLYIAEGVGLGGIDLTDVTVKGTILVKGGADSFSAANVKAGRIVLERKGVTAVFSGSSLTDVLEVRENATIRYNGTGGYALADRLVVPKGADGKTLTLSNVNADVLENNGDGTTLKGTGTFGQKEGDGSYTKESGIIIGSGSTEPGDDTSTSVAVEKTITIYSFNDFHGTLDQSVSSSNPGADRFVGFLKAQVAKNPANSLVLVAGDNYQGSALSNYNLGKPVSDMIKSIGSPYSALGNHEFDWNTDLISDWAEDGNLTFLAANIIDEATGETPDFCEPYAIRTVNGVKIGIIGFITRETPTLVKAANVAGLQFVDPAPIAEELSAKLRALGCSVVIALTHMGASQSSPNTDSPISGEAARLADGVAPGTLDAVIAGHSHTRVAGRSTVNGTPIVQGYYNGRGLGKLTFVVKGRTVKSVTPEYLAVPTSGDNPIDADTTQMVAGYNEAIAPILDEVVGRIDAPFTSKDEVADWAGQLIYDYIERNVGETYVLFQNAGGWRSGTWGDGSPKDNKVTVRYLFTLMPFDNEIVLIDEMSGTDLLGLLSGKQKADSSANFGSDAYIHGAYQDTDGDWCLPGGAKIVADGTYKVACNDFMLTGGDKFDWFIPYSEDSSTFKFIGTPLRDAMIAQLKYEGLPTEGEVRELTIFFTSDLHGAFASKNFATGSAHAGMARIATLLKTKRAALLADGKEWLTLDVGDTIQGAGTSGFINNPAYTYPVLKGMDYLEFDAEIMGNHEFNFGFDAMYQAYNGTGNNDGVPGYQGVKLSGNVFKGNFTGDANVTGDDPLMEDFEAYHVFDVSGVRVAVIGMTNPGSDQWDAIKFQTSGYYTESAIGATKRAIAEIKDGDLADVIVLAAHMSTDDSFGRAGSGASSVLADEYIAENVDVFLGGHGHSRQTRTINGVKYGENSSAGGSLGTATIKATYEDGKWSVKDKADSGVSITMQQISASGSNNPGEDSDYLDYMAAEIAEAEIFTATKIGELTGANMVLPSPLSENINLAYSEPTKLVDFIHDVQLYYAEAQISIACPFNTTVQHRVGDITRGSLIGIYNYDSNTVYRVDMAGWQVDRFMEYVARTQYSAPRSTDELSIRHSTSYRNDSLGGVQYTVDLTQPEGDRVTITHVRNLTTNEWEAFDSEARYIVAANDYRTSSTLLTPTDPVGGNPNTTAVFTRAELAAEDAPFIIQTDCNRDLPIAPDILSLMVHYIAEVNGGVIDGTDYEKNWEITPWWDAALRAEGEALIAEGYITGVSANNPLTKQMVEAGRIAKQAAQPLEADAEVAAEAPDLEEYLVAMIIRNAALPV